MSKYTKENTKIDSDLAKSIELRQKYALVSRDLSIKFIDAKNKRKTLEEKWLRNRRQYDGIEENPSMRKEIKDGRSKTYEKYTTLKVDQQRARLYELFMPTGDKNFALDISNNPKLPLKKLQNIIANLENQIGPNFPKTIIQKAVRDIALENASNLEDLMEDYLSASDYEQIIQELCLSAGIFGSGVIKGPTLRKVKRTSFNQDDNGNWVASEKEVEEPFFESVPVWEWFPDLDAKTREDQDYVFLYQVKTKADLLNLKEEDGYIIENIKQFLNGYQDGNFDYQWYETQLIALSNESIIGKPKKFRVTEYWGNIDADKVRDVLDVNDDEKIISVNVIMLNDTVIKCVRNPFTSGKLPVTFFNLYSGGGMLTGRGLCDLLEEKQRQLNACVRAKFDNMAQNATPMIEINRDLINPQDMPDRFNPGRVIWRTGSLESAQAPAIRSITIQNNIGEFLQIEQAIKHDMDVISSLSGLSTGDMTDVGKTLGRTSSGVQALMGSSNTNLKDISKHFDSYSKYVYEMLIEVIYLIDPQREDIQGDFNVTPKVSTAIIERQTTANNLQAFINQLQPEQRTMVNWIELTKSELKLNNLKPSDVMLDIDLINQQQQAQSQQAQQGQAQQQQMIQQQQLIEQQKVQNDTIKSEGKRELDLAKAQQLMQQIELMRNKGELDSMLALHKIDNDRTNSQLQEDNLKHNILSSEFDRQEQFAKNMSDLQLRKQELDNKNNQSE